MAEENNIDLDYIEAAKCFDDVRTKGRPRKVLNGTGVKVIEGLSAYAIYNKLGIQKERVQYNTKNETNPRGWFSSYKKRAFCR